MKHKLRTIISLLFVLVFTGCRLVPEIRPLNAPSWLQGEWVGKGSYVPPESNNTTVEIKNIRFIVEDKEIISIQDRIEHKDGVDTPERWVTVFSALAKIERQQENSYVLEEPRETTAFPVWKEYFTKIDENSIRYRHYTLNMEEPLWDTTLTRVTYE